jgi:hypothetical protein
VRKRWTGRALCAVVFSVRAEEVDGEGAMYGDSFCSMFLRKSVRSEEVDGEGVEVRGVRSLASNFVSWPLDLRWFFSEPLILIETKSCIQYFGYTVVRLLSGERFHWWTKNNLKWSIIVEALLVFHREVS